jgi:hypothetical protein
MTRPQTTEYAPYYSRYVDLIATPDVVPELSSQLEKTVSFLSNISEEKSLSTYGAGKWTIKEVLNHVNDTERVFLYRAFWFARGFEQPLPGYDQDVCVAAARPNSIPFTELIDEFKHVRLSTLSIFRNMPDEAWGRTGIASDNPFTVRALAYIITGHVAHHLNVLQERYL